jgi:hypothetical protein
MSECENNVTIHLNNYEMQDLIYIESMVVICPLDIVAHDRIISML